MSTSNISNIDIISLTDREIRQLSRSVTRVLDAHPGLPEEVVTVLRVNRMLFEQVLMARHLRAQQQTQPTASEEDTEEAETDEDEEMESGSEENDLGDEDASEEGIEESADEEEAVEEGPVGVTTAVEESGDQASTGSAEDGENSEVDEADIAGEPTVLDPVEPLPDHPEAVDHIE